LSLSPLQAASCNANIKNTYFLIAHSKYSHLPKVSDKARHRR